MNQEWRSLCSDGFEHAVAVAACRQLGFVSVSKLMTMTKLLACNVHVHIITCITSVHACNLHDIIDVAHFMVEGHDTTAISQLSDDHYSTIPVQE